MKTLSLWIRPEALTNGQIKEKACNEYMNIMEVTGKDVLYPDMPKGFHALLLFLTEGEISFVMKEEKIVVIAPACIDFVFISQLNDVKTSENFKGTLIIITDQIFFKKATETFRFSLSKVIYYYSQKPFVLFTQQEIERVTQLTGFLENIIKQKEHRFNNDMVRNFLQSILYEIGTKSYVHLMIKSILQNTLKMICLEISFIWCIRIAENIPCQMVCRTTLHII